MMMARGQRNRADDRRGDGEEQWARRGYHDHGEEAFGLPAEKRRDRRNTERYRRVPRAQLITEPPEFGALLLCLLHHFHDAGVARIFGESFSTDDEHLFTVDRARNYHRARRFRNFASLARWVGFVHHAVAFDHGAVDRADFVRQNSEFVASANVGEFYVDKAGRFSAVSNVGHAPRECIKHRRGARGGEGFEGLAAREHQHHDSCHKILAEHDGGEN
jgi:hypothetical protein